MLLNEAVERRLRAIRREFPDLWAGLDRLLSGLEADTAHCLQELYATLDPRDLVSLPPELLLDYARASRRARAELPYAAQIPEELFVRYVLPPRVNNEFPGGSRAFLYERLAPRVQGLDLLSAALEVNYWCAEQAAYQPTDERTIAPYGMLYRGLGRCGEESTLLVSALRAVGVPARQCYAPWWAHCDDNHAWVEFWAQEQWHYTGACEPEPVPDVGWFTSAASRAMLVRSFAPDLERGGYELVNTTAQYGDTAVLTVLVSQSGKPLAGLPVRFQLVNDCQLQTLCQRKTDGKGAVSLEAGLGCLVVSALLENRLVEQLVDVRRTRTVTLRWEDGFDPLTQERTGLWELIPPAETIPSIPAEHDDHLARLAQCRAIREEREARLSQADSRWLRLAGGNRGEIAHFLSLPAYSQEDKELLLSTLTEKDFADVTCETLEDFLAAALPWKERWPLELWQAQILAPRVEQEPLLPVRRALYALLAGAGLTRSRDVLAWMDAHLRPLEEYGRTDRRGNAAAYVRHGACPPSERGLLAVQICRALGIPAQLDPITKSFSSPEHNESYSPVSLTLVSEEPKLRYREHFTLARWTGQVYQGLNLDGRSVSGSVQLSLPPGAYSLITARRQIDGTASVRAQRFLLHEDQVRALVLAPDRTAEMLRHIPLPKISLSPLSRGREAPDGPCGLLLFLQPGEEPTEHLLQELLALAGEYRQLARPIAFLLSSGEGLENVTLQRALNALPTSACFLCRETDRYAVQHAMGLGDHRLPLAVALDEEGRGVYAWANYHIRLAARLLGILRLTRQTAVPRPAALPRRSDPLSDRWSNF